ncbi:LysR family transcriptional regulator [Cochlodiniinecator piscidefendens]|uniref:LysR family transcriptional regulator n=1 Tax=Cochlodiniinecator piscidefendens TaxID=2715756 RepID=UPI001408BDF8|nr:LysR family transcriptional regulator [Cochlodiniinecator piscidefendens]
MSRHIVRNELSLKGLELFQICAQKGSLQAVATETGLSVSTISHHLRNLEKHLGVELFNHARKPMILSPKGHVFLRNIDGALLAIRKAKAEASAGNISEASFLRVGVIEDFDSDITPELAVYLSRNMPSCDFLYHTDSSHTIVEMLRNRQLDLGVTTTPPDRLNGLQERPLLRDPFVIVLPRTDEASLNDIVSGKTNLPFLRFSSNLIIAQQIEAQLRRLGVSSPNKFECGNHQTLMAMVAAGAGWTITTPLLFSRAKRFQPKLSIHPFPGKSFSRTLTIITTPDCSRSILDLVDQKMRSLITKHAITPFHSKTPWLKESFVLVN